MFPSEELIPSAIASGIELVLRETLLNVTHRIEKEQKGNSVLQCVPVKFGYSRSAMFRGMNSATRVLSEQ